MGILTITLDFLQSGTLQRAVVFCVAFGASRRLVCAIEINNQTVFHNLYHKRSLDLLHPTNETRLEVLSVPFKRKLTYNHRPIVSSFHCQRPLAIGTVSDTVSQIYLFLN